jgi:hypothetical protein
VTATTLPIEEPPAGLGRGLDELDARATLAAARRSVTARRAAEVEEILLALRWADLHGHPLRDRDPMTRPGGDGTPQVREYALPELAMARETHTLTARALTADALDLRHRLPLTWRKVRDLTCEPWVARKVAVLSRSLTRDRVETVDRAVSMAIAGHAPSTVFEIAEAKVIEADTEAHAMERERERHRRYVSVSRADEFGFRKVIARVTAGDAAWLDGMVDRLADTLAPAHGHDHNRDELRSLGLGVLARPVEALAALLGDTARQPVDPEPPAWWHDQLPHCLDRLASMSTRQLAALRPKGVVHVHLTDRALARQHGIARVEGVGPLLVQSLCELLGHADVQLQPVLDLAQRRRVDQYEIPDPIKDQAWQLAGGDCFPFSPRTATRGDPDFDHCTSYDRDGPLGQTGAHNCGPLRRRHHRWKTHGGYRCRPAGPGRYLWQTPHGLCYLVDHRGTRSLDPADAEIMLTAPPDVEVYLPEQQLLLLMADR